MDSSGYFHFFFLIYLSPQIILRSGHLFFDAAESSDFENREFILCKIENDTDISN